MADRKLAISELLCFLFYKLKTNNISVIRRLILDFYNTVDIAAAKDRLVEDVKSLNLENVDRLSRRRRDSIENRNQLDLDDIFSILSVCDEKRITEKLPIYVAGNMENIPLLKMEEGEFRILKNKSETILAEQKNVAIDISNKLNLFGQHTSGMSDAILDQQKIIAIEIMNKLDQIVQQMNVVEGHIQSFIIPHVKMAENGHGSKVQSGDHTATTQTKLLVSTEQASHGSVISANSNFESTDDEAGDVNNTGFEVVIGNRKKKRRKRRANSSPITTNLEGGVSYSQAAGRAPSQGTAKFPAINTPGNENNKRFLGQGSCPGQSQLKSKLLASRSLHKRAFFYVGNIANEFKDTDVLLHMEEIMEIKGISCFEIKNENKNQNRTDNFIGSKSARLVAPSKSFRVCIRLEDVAKLLDLNRWPDSILIRRWVFKPKVDRVNPNEEKKNDEEDVDETPQATIVKDSANMEYLDCPNEMGRWSQAEHSERSGEATFASNG